MSQDCNSNQVPDECDIADCVDDPACDDCNSNGVPDACDIAAGFSEDVNEDGVPDECPAPDQWCLGDLDCSHAAPTFTDITYFVAGPQRRVILVAVLRRQTRRHAPDLPMAARRLQRHRRASNSAT